MSYSAAVDHLYALGHELAPTSPSTPRRKFDLEHMRILAHALGDPQATFPSVLIAGTNGKGSTSASLASILTAAGYRTALYTSPHLSRVNERIQVSGTSISDDDFARLYFRVDDTAQRLVREAALPQHPSFFETLTALAFAYFAEQQIDIAILEVGMGGRLDATNIVEPLLSIITDISLDHQDYLGHTIAEIAREKAGILRPRGTLITIPQHPEANQAIGEVAATLDLHAISAAPYVPHTPIATDQEDKSVLSEARVPHPSQLHREGWESQTLPRNRYSLTLAGQPLEIDSPLLGQHQQRNIALAIAAAEELRNPMSYKSLISNSNSYKITNQQIEEGIRNTRWPGRLELIRLPEGPALILDVAHNPAGAWTLRAAISQLPEEQPRTLLFSCLRDKDIREMTQILLPLFDSSADRPPSRWKDHVLFAPIHNPRAASLDDLLAAARSLDVPATATASIEAALAEARRLTPPNGLILATGSIYLVGELRQLVLNEVLHTA
ncbi:bifunctional folylpolyglutamate synthase/dihydrofolate synthase [Edaphobacter bradus]|uniref:bifunctional folylpolyglutamate synthase/dihydrofolate synthase n=1 Tax=Edaphobacter bradus TaxID=2259016 RepID=UPI0021DF8535|nr:folylpolyglutamate synthase/dihydrofolate synthase family protein [Edaphobacter bradus]